MSFAGARYGPAIPTYQDAFVGGVRAFANATQAIECRDTEALAVKFTVRPLACRRSSSWIPISRASPICVSERFSNTALTAPSGGDSDRR
jgi:hypothetical protein